MSGAIEPGVFHRLGIAIRQGQDDPAAWFQQVLGAQVEPTRPEPGDVHLTTKARVGTTDLAVFAAPGTEGTIGRFVARYGPGLHSVAWHVDDLWVVENVLRDSGITITGTNVAARHFFMHPRDTFGILVEWTDHLPEAGRDSSSAAGVAYITAAVPDLAPAVSFFVDTCGALQIERFAPGPRADEETADLAIGDMVLRLVAPKSERSRFAGFLSGGGRGLHSFALSVDDLSFPVDRGLTLVGQGEASVWTDPTTTLGLRLEWVLT